MMARGRPFGKSALGKGHCAAQVQALWHHIKYGHLQVPVTQVFKHSSLLARDCKAAAYVLCTYAALQ